MRKREILAPPPEPAMKSDYEKPRLDLVAPDFIWAVARVLTFGAAKYEDWNWALGKKWSRDYGAVMRHLTQWAGGEDHDRESGLPHLWHAACDLMFLIVSERRGLGTDDRCVLGDPSAMKGEDE